MSPHHVASMQASPCCSCFNSLSLASTWIRWWCCLWCRCCLWFWPFSLLLIADSSCFCLKIPHLPQVNPHCSCTKWVPFRSPSMLLIGCPESSDQCIEASPCLTERTWAGCWWVREAKEWTSLVVDFGLAKLIKVSKEFKDMSTTAHGKRKRGPVIPKVLAESVPVSALLILIATWGGRWGRGRCGWCGRGGDRATHCWAWKVWVCWRGGQIHVKRWYRRWD